MRTVSQLLLDNQNDEPILDAADRLYDDDLEHLAGILSELREVEPFETEQYLGVNLVSDDDGAMTVVDVSAYAVGSDEPYYVSDPAIVKAMRVVVSDELHGMSGAELIAHILGEMSMAGTPVHEVESEMA